MPATDIEWTDRAWPVVNGCRRVSPGCENCWAELLTATRLRHHPRYKGLAIYGEHGARWTGERRLALDLLDEPLRVRRPQKWFVANKGDLFGEEVPDEQIAMVFAVMAMAPRHTFQVLTKRAERLPQWYARARQLVDLALQVLAAMGTLGDRWKHGPLPKLPTWPLPNVWVGVSIEDQQRADERAPFLQQIEAAVRWYSIEPLLGPIERLPLDGIHWAVVGGESGRRARPMALEWALDIRHQLQRARVPLFFKQAGAVAYVENANLWDIPRAWLTDPPAGVTAAAAARLILGGSKGDDFNELRAFMPQIAVREWPRTA